MYKKIILFLYRLLKKINQNTDVALQNLGQHLYFMDYEDREDDIYIVTFPKSGTTWMQVIVYNLITDGNMDFNHIYDVSPWPHNEAFNGLSPDKINKIPSPRILKSHQKYNEFNSNCKAKFIHLYRDGKDVAVSLYHHNKNYTNPDISFNSTFENFFLESNKEINWFLHTNEWLHNKNNLDILYLSYEQIKNNFDNTIHKIAVFLNVSLTEVKMQRVREHASFKYMKENEKKFGEKPINDDKLVYNQFIRNGEIGEGEVYLTEIQKNEYEIRYKTYIEPYLKTY